MKSAEIIGQVFGLVVGNNFTTPAAKTMERYTSVTQIIAFPY